MTKEERNEYMRNYRKNNKDRVKEIQKKSYNKNINVIKNKNITKSNEIKEYSKKYRETNKEKLKKDKKLWYLNNKDKVKEQVKKYQKLRKSNDPIFKLKANIRTMLSNILAKRGFTKKSNTFDIVGCSYGEFILYIESKFENWMDWDNYGIYNGNERYGWDIDHIIPMSSAKTEDDVIRLNHFTNLQPLCSKINRDIKIDN
jgi:hypothetical protein